MLAQVAIFSFALLALAGAIIDLGLARTTQVEMQTAADSAALEGAEVPLDLLRSGELERSPLGAAVSASLRVTAVARADAVACAARCPRPDPGRARVVSFGRRRCRPARTRRWHRACRCISSWWRHWCLTGSI